MNNTVIKTLVPTTNATMNTTPVRTYGEPYAHKFYTVDIFLNITRRQAISPVAKFHHVLGRGFMTQQVILIFIKCLSANQNLRINYFTLKYNIFYYQIVLILNKNASIRIE